MNFEQELDRAAGNYAKQGYKVILRPKPEDLPHFAKDFKVEILAKRGAEGVLVAVKKNREEVDADTNLPRYAEVTGSQPGWRFDLAVVEGESPIGRQRGGTRDFSADDINKTLAEAEEIARMGFVRAAVISAWAGMEAAMRMRLRAAGEKAGWGTMPREMLSELYSSGLLARDEYQRLLGLTQLRNEIVHGFSTSIPDEHSVRSLIEVAQRLLEESQRTKQPA